MKTCLRIILAAILLLTWNAKAAWVVGDLRDSSETNFPLLSVVITPKSTPQAVNGLTVIDVVRNMRVTNGAFGPVWLVGGNYDFDAGVGKHFKILVPPNDTNTYQLN